MGVSSQKQLMILETLHNSHLLMNEKKQFRSKRTSGGHMVQPPALRRAQSCTRLLRASSSPDLQVSKDGDSPGDLLQRLTIHIPNNYQLMEKASIKLCWQSP